MPRAVARIARPRTNGTCVARVEGLDLVTNMQWFYARTWKSTMQVCAPQTSGRLPAARGSGCASLQDFHARQMELVEVLRRNALHPAVRSVHVLVGEDAPVRRYLERLPWFRRRGCGVVLVPTGTRPTFKDYMAYISSRLIGRTVALVNQDTFLASGWEGKRAASLLPPRTAFLLSRYHARTTYDVQHQLAAGEGEGIFDGPFVSQVKASAAAAAALEGRAGTRAVAKGKATAKHAGREAGAWRTCDMTTSRFNVWLRSLCSRINFGSYDAYVLRLDAPLSPAVLDLFDYPQNAWGGENVFQYILQDALKLRTANPCLTLRVTHMHCELPTTFSARKVGDRRQGKREVALKVQAKMRAMGLPISMKPGDIGGLALNVTAYHD